MVGLGVSRYSNPIESRQYTSPVLIKEMAFILQIGIKKNHPKHQSYSVYKKGTSFLPSGRSKDFFTPISLNLCPKEYLWHKAEYALRPPPDLDRPFK